MKTCSTTPRTRAVRLPRSVRWGIGLLAAVLAFAQPKPAGMVHIYRYKLSQGKASHPTVSCDAFPVARIQNGRVYTLKASAGRHSFTVADTPIGIDVDVEPGKDYFVRIDYPVNSSFAVGATPVLVAPEQGSKEIQKLQPLDGWFIEAATCGKP